MGVWFAGGISGGHINPAVSGSNPTHLIINLILA
jgi:aquaglyceroporin related protein, other eukaryote